MFDKKETPNSAVDWAERLKASMNTENTEPADSPAPAPSAEDDDLAALLRAQLAHREKATPTSGFDLDTSEFEEESEEEFEEFEEEEFEEEEFEEISAEATEEFRQEDEDTPAPEDEEDLPWEDEEDEYEIPDTLPEPEAMIVYSAEETEDDEEENLDAEDEADLPWEDEEDEDDIPDTLPEPETMIVYSAEEIEDDEEEILDAEDEDDLPWEDEEDEDDDPDTLPEPAPVVVYRAEETTPVHTDEISASVCPPARHYTFEPVPFEEDEMISPDGVVGDVRLAIVEEESTRLLEELQDTEEAVAEPMDEESEAPEAAVATHTDEPVSTEKKDEPVRQTVAHDPLQLGLDDILPRVESLPSSDAHENTPIPESNRSSENSDYTYTRRMTRHARDREETVRDAELYLRLGYEKQLMRGEQQEAVVEARRRARERKASPARNETTPVGRKRREFTDPKQTPALERAYIRARRLALTRLLIAAVGALFAILHDLLGTLSLTVGADLYTDTRIYPVVSILLTTVVCLPFLPRLGRGLASLFDFEPTRYAVSALALIAATAHGMVTVFTRGSYLYGGVALFMLAVAAATEYVATLAEEASFSVVSAGKESFVLTDEITPAAIAHGEDSPGEPTLTAVRTGRVSDFFARTGRYNPYMGRLNYLLPVALLASIACAGLAVLKNGNLLINGLPVFTAAYLTCLPAAYVVAMSLPLLISNRLLSRKGATVLGTAAPMDLCRKGSTRLLVRDGDAVGGLFSKEITLRDDPMADLWRSKTAVLFRLLECPLWKDSPLSSDLSEDLCVEVAETEEGYVRLFLIDLKSGETNDIMMGGREALTRRGVRLPKASMEQVYKKTDKSRVVYLAFDGAFRIAYAVEYRLGTTFADAVDALASLGDTAALVTYDPLTEDGLLQVERLKDAPPVRILRPAFVEPVRKSCSSCVVATGRSLDLLHPYAACHRMKKVYRLSHLISWLAIPTAMVLSVVATLSGCSALLSSAAVTVWQILLAGASVALSLLTVTRKSLFLTRKSPANRTAGKHTPAPKSAVSKAESKTDKDRKTS